jgi:hypothetical protein
MAKIDDDEIHVNDEVEGNDEVFAATARATAAVVGIDVALLRGETREKGGDPASEKLMDGTDAAVSVEFVVPADHDVNEEKRAGQDTKEENLDHSGELSNFLTPVGRFPASQAWPCESPGTRTEQAITKFGQNT